MGTHLRTQFNEERCLERNVPVCCGGNDPQFCTLHFALCIFYNRRLRPEIHHSSFFIHHSRSATSPCAVDGTPISSADNIIGAKRPEIPHSLFLIPNSRSVATLNFAFCILHFAFCIFENICYNRLK